MVSLSTTVARHRILYSRPILTMPDILMIDMPTEFASSNLSLGNYHPILIETIAEQHELEAYLEQECEDPGSPDLLDSRPSSFPADHLTVAHYGPPFEDWPYVLLCRWPPHLAEAAPEELHLFVRGVYTIELYSDRDEIERASDNLLALLKRRRRTRVEIVLADWSVPPGTAPH